VDLDGLVAREVLDDGRQVLELLGEPVEVRYRRARPGQGEAVRRAR
jgi:hypothetical protein